MNKILIMGAGLQGAAEASIMVRDDFVDEVVLADFNKEALQKVKDKLQSPKLITKKVNADNISEIAAAAEGAGVIMDFVMPWHSKNVMKAALEVGANYVNTAFDDPFWGQLVNGEPLLLDEEFQEAGLTALLGCGSTPGIFNVVARLYADKMDTVDTIALRCCVKPDESIESKIQPWNPGWAPAQALIDFSTKPMIFRDGKYEEVPLFNEPEYYDFGEYLKGCPCTHHSHEEAYSMPYSFRDKGIRNCNFKYFLDERAATFVKMGFTPDNVIEIDGKQIRPFDVVVELTEKPGEFFFSEQPPADTPEESLWGQSIEVYGKKDGEDVVYKVMLPEFAEYPKEVYGSCGTMMVSVALPACVGAKVCMEGTKKGVVFAEQLDPERFLQLLREKVPSYTLREF